MRLLFVPYSAWGHVLPMLAVVGELTRRGVPVRVVAGAAFRSAVESVGARAVVPAVGHEVRVPAGWAPGELADRAELWWRRRVARAATRRTLEAELGGDRPDLCVVDPHIRWAGRLMVRRGAETVPLWTTHARAVCGRADPVLVNAMPELQPGRSRFGPGVHFVGPLSGLAPHGSGETAWSVAEGPTLVVASGTVFDRPAEFFRRIVDAFAGTEWTVVLATARLPVRELGPLPRNIHAQRWIPQAAALREATVFVTHAGMNSVHDAILAGVPMILVPRTREQRRTAARLHRLGVGVPLRRWSDVARQSARLASDPLVYSRLEDLRGRAEASRGAARAADLLMDSADRRRVV